MLHGITMTGANEMVLWQPETLRVILAVRKMRDAGIPVFFSIDTGATVYVNTFPDRGEEVERRIQELGMRTIRCHVGGPAHVIGDHLF
jgi:phosphomevalonate decarboxylase